MSDQSHSRDERIERIRRERFISRTVDDIELLLAVIDERRASEPQVSAKELIDCISYAGKLLMDVRDDFLFRAAHSKWTRESNLIMDRLREAGRRDRSIQK